MALREKSLILYDLEVTENNRSIDFQNVAFGPQINATVNLGFYSLTSLMEAIASAMNIVDPTNTYTCTADRTYNDGTENRVTIATNGAFLSLLFATGTRSASTIAPLIGFSGDQTANTTYTGTSTSGVALIPDMVAYNYLSPEFYRRVQGSVNISASGIKEAIVFQIQRFFKLQFKYEPQDKVISEWSPFWDWAIQQRPFDFTPEYSTAPNDVTQVTLEKTGAEGKGIGFEMKEMLPQYPFLYDTGPMEFRVVDET